MKFYRLFSRRRVAATCGKITVVVLVGIVTTISPVSASDTSCQTNAMGDKNCITAVGTKSGYSVKVTWNYKVARNTVIRGYSVKSTEWGANILCASRYGVVTYVTAKNSSGRAIPIGSRDLRSMSSGLTANVIPRLISGLCG